MPTNKIQSKPAAEQKTRTEAAKINDKKNALQPAGGAQSGSDSLMRVAAEPGKGTSQDIIALQRLVGNQFVTTLIQTKLTVGAAHDPYEQEADKVADQVMTMPAAQPTAQRQAAPEEEKVQTKLDPSVQREGVPQEEEVQAKPDPHASFDASQDVETKLHAHQGSGAPLPSDLRSFMEPRFGADFSQVRVHTGSESATLNRLLSAQAFTHEKDIYLGEGHEDIQSNDGQRLMAHELTHVVQQTGGQAPTSAQRIRRLSLINTHWNSARDFSVSAGGGTGGVLFLSDAAGSLVVKPGQQLAPEIVLSAALTNAAFDQEGQPGTPEQYSVSTPSARIAPPAEVAIIKAKAIELFHHKPITDLGTEGQKQADRRQMILTNLDQPTTVIFNAAGGEDMNKLIEGMTHTKKKTFSKEQIANKESPLIKMITEPGQLNALGKAAAIDIFMGNGDRTVGKFNPENWRTDTGSRSVHLIDNVENSPVGFFVSHGEQGSAKDGFKQWILTQYVKRLGEDNFQAIAHDVIDLMIMNMVEMGEMGLKINAQDLPLIAKSVYANRARMENWFQQGLSSGKNSLKKVLSNPDRLVAGLPEAQRREALLSILARRHALNNMVDLAAWYAAETTLALFYPLPHAPAPVPAAPPPVKPWTRGVVRK